MSNTLISEEERELLIKEVDIICFFLQNKEEGQELSIIIYDEEEDNPHRVDVQKNFVYSVENNKIKICNKWEEESVFELDYSYYDLDFIGEDEYLQLMHREKLITIYIVPKSSVSEEEDSLCMQLEKISL